MDTLSPELPRRLLRTVDPACHASLLVPGTALRGSCGMAFDAAGRILVGQVASARIMRLDPDSGAIDVFIGPERGVLGTDDITSDAEGTCWTSCATGLGGESVFRIEASGAARALYAGIVGANGIAFDRRRGRLFVGQFGGGNGLYEIDPDGHRAPRLISKAFASTNAMDFDRQGRLLVTVDGGRIARVDPDTGEHAVLGVHFPHNSALKSGRDGELYVCGYDNGEGRLWRVSADGNTMELLASAGLPPLDNLLYAPVQHRLFASSLRDATVLELSLDGTGRVLRRFSLPGPMTMGSIGVAGGMVYVNDGLSIRRFDADSASLVPTQGSYFARSGFPLPGCLLGDADGSLLMASGCQFPLIDARNARLYRVDTCNFGVRVIDNGSFQGVAMPSALASDGKRLYVAEFLDGRIVALGLDGDDTVRRQVGQMLLGPLGLAHRHGRLYVAESLGQRIGVIDLASGRQDVLVASGIGRPTALAIDPVGRLLAIDAEGRRLLRIDSRTGAVVTLAEHLPVYPIVASNWPLLGIANGLALDADGRIYIGGNDDGSLWRIDLESSR